MEIQRGGEKMRFASGQQGENERQWKINVNMNTGNKILGKHIRRFLHKNKIINKKNKSFTFLVIQNNVEVVNDNGKGKTKKRAARPNLVFAN